MAFHAVWSEGPLGSQPGRLMHSKPEPPRPLPAFRGATRQLRQARYPRERASRRFEMPSAPPCCRGLSRQWDGAMSCQPSGANAAASQRPPRHPPPLHLTAALLLARSPRSPRTSQTSMQAARRIDTASAPQAEVHLVPALIEHNGPAAVQAYFRPQETGALGLPQAGCGVCLPSWLWLWRAHAAKRCRSPAATALDSSSGLLLFRPRRTHSFISCVPPGPAGTVVDGLPVLQCSLRGRHLAGAEASAWLTVAVGCPAQGPYLHITRSTHAGFDLRCAPVAAPSRTHA